MKILAAFLPVFLAAPALLGGGCAGGPSAEGDEAMETGDWAWALVLYARAVEEGRVSREDVADRMARCERKISEKARAEAEALAETGDFEGALAKLEEARGLVPRDERLAEALASARIQALSRLDARAKEADERGDHLRALGFWEKARACEPGGGGSRVARSLAAAAQRACQAGRREAAWVYLAMAADCDPSLEEAETLRKTLRPLRVEADAVVAEAEAALRDGKFEEAARLCADALGRWPGHARALGIRSLAERERAFWTLVREGDVHVTRKEWDRAVSCYEKAQAEVLLLAIERKIREARAAKWMEEGRRLEEACNVEGAIEAFGRALESVEDRKPLEDRIRRLQYEFHFGLAAAAEEARDWVRAWSEFRRAEGFAADPSEARGRIRALQPHLDLSPCVACRGTGATDAFREIESNGRTVRVRIGTKPCPDCGGLGETAKAKD